MPLRPFRVPPGRLIAFGLFASIAAGCGPGPETAAVVRDRPAERVVTASVDVVATLTPSARTLVRPYSGSVLVGQASGDGRSATSPLRLIAADGTPRPVPFDAAAVAGVLRVPAADVNLRDVWPLADGRCLVLVNGWAGERALLSLWLYRPADGALTRVADAGRLGRLTGAGESGQLADGRLVGGRDAAWLCLSVFGKTSVVRLDTGVDGTVAPRLVAERLLDDAGRPIGVEDAALWPIDDDTALLVRTDGTASYRLDLPRGLATNAPAGLPPVTVTGNGPPRRWSFRPAAARPRTEAETWTADPQRLPTLTITPDAGPPTVIDRDGLHTRLGFPTYAMRITAWCAEPAGGRVLAYDAMSGEIVRISVDQ